MYHNAVRAGPSHSHGDLQKIHEDRVQRFQRYARGQRDRHTDRHSLISSGVQVLRLWLNRNGWIADRQTDKPIAILRSPTGAE